jgi:hypothetical protein
VTRSNGAGRKRPARVGRRGLVAVGAALTLLPLGAGSASAETFLNDADPCTVPAPPAQFADRGEILSVHIAQVDCAFAQEIVFGRDEGGQRFYRPARDVSRGQMAAFIKRTLQAGGFTLPAPQPTRFNDVPEGSTFDDDISQLAQIGVVEGKTDGGYDPEESVRRDQMASFMVRAAEFAYEGDMLDGNTSPDYQFPFVDVVPTNVHRANIAAADDLIAVTQGRTENMYDPDLPVRRDQMATFVVRLLDVTAIPASTR